jgi:hypothetical protein
VWPKINTTRRAPAGALMKAAALAASSFNEDARPLDRAVAISSPWAGPATARRHGPNGTSAKPNGSRLVASIPAAGQLRLNRRFHR